MSDETAPIMSDRDSLADKDTSHPETKSRRGKPIDQSVREVELSGIKLAEFQQPINCCNITAVAMGFSALGYPTTVDEIFHICKLKAEFVVDDGMTLAETYNAAMDVARSHGGLFVECYHFDEDTLTLDQFRDAIHSVLSCEDDILLCNFGVKIAMAGTTEEDTSRSCGVSIKIAKMFGSARSIQ